MGSQPKVVDRSNMKALALAVGMLVPVMATLLMTSGREPAALAVTSNCVGILVKPEPVITYTYPTPGGDTKWYTAPPGAVIDIDFGAQDGLQRAQYQVASLQWQDIFRYSSCPNITVSYTATWAVSWSLLAEGATEVSLQVRDCKNNTVTHQYRPEESGFRFRKDTVAPQSEAQSPAYSPLGKPISVTWTAGDTTSGIKETCLWYKLEETGTYATTGLCAEEGSGTFQFTPERTGSYFFQTVSSDQAGNVEAGPDGDGDTKTEVFYPYYYLPLTAVGRLPADWHPGSQTTGLTVYSLAVCSRNPQVVYAGTEANGVYRSTDGGRTWSPTTLTTQMVRGIAVHPTDCNTIYAAPWGLGVYRTTDGGASWTPRNEGLIKPYLYALAIDPASPTVIYAGTQGGGVFKSTDSGDSWTQSGLSGETVAHLAIAPQVSNTLYAGTWGNGIYKSTNGAASWSSVNTGLGNKYIYAVVIDSNNPQVLYAATYQDGVYRSEDGGNSWHRDGLESRVAYCITLGESVAYAGTDGTGDGNGVYKCVSGSWKPMEKQPGFLKVRSLVFSGSILLAGTTDGVWWYGW